MRIALLDHQPQRAEQTREALSASGYACQWFLRTSDFVAETTWDAFNLFIIAGPPCHAPLNDALSVVSEVSRRDTPPPLLVLLPESSDRNVISLLEAGADDCLATPFNVDMLVARIATLTRRHARVVASEADRHVSRFDDYRFDPVGGMVDVNGEAIELTPKEMTLATLFFRNRGRPLSRRYLIETIWRQASAINSRSLDTHVSRIRRKLRLYPETGHQLTALYRQGYQLSRISDLTGMKNPVESFRDNLSHPIVPPEPNRRCVGVVFLPPTYAKHLGST